MRSLKDNSELRSNIYLIFTYLDLCIVEGEGASHNEVDQQSKILRRPRRWNERSQANISPTPRQEMRTGAHMNKFVHI